jgi:Cyclic nucleotide-binding domain
MTGRERYLERVVADGCSIRLPQLRAERAGVLHRGDRGGVGVVALRAEAVSAEERDALLRFRFAQYLAVGFVDPELARGERLVRDPGGPDAPGSVDCVAFDADDGLLLASLSMRAPGRAPAGTTLSTRERPLLPLEEHFGWGALNRLRLLPELPLERVRELSRFVKNQRLSERAELGTRAVVEVCIAALRCLTGPLSLEVEAFAGEFEDAVARRHLEFLDTPFVMMRGGLPAFEPGHFLRPALDGRVRYPFAGLVSDLASTRARLQAIEAALDEPGLGGLMTLAAAPGQERPRSSLLPPDGVAVLADTPLPQRELGAAARRRARALGARLRSFAPLAALSDTECTTLHRLLEPLQMAAGATVVARGEPADALFLIERGEARVEGAATLGPGDWFGEIGLLTGGRRTADVVAATPLRLLRLGGDVFRRHLHPLPDVHAELTRVALLRAAARLEAA